MKNYTGGFGTGMGKYGDKEYPEFYPNDKVIITIPYYSKKVAKDIIIGEGIIMDAPVYDGKKPYLVKINKYGTNGYEKYPNNLYNGLEIDMNSYILVSSKNISNVPIILSGS